MNSQSTAASYSLHDTTPHSSLSWRAVFAGALIALLSYMILMSLGLAFGGANLEGVISGNDTAKGLGIGTAIWMIVTLLISIFAGAYAASRANPSFAVRVGRLQGLVVTALFFTLVLSQVGNAVGFLSRGLGSTVSAIGGAAGDVAQNSKVQQIVDDAIGDLNLKASPETVATGVATRLLQGNEQSALNYLSRQTGISQAEARTRIDTVKTQVADAAREVGSAAAEAMKIAGWTLFISLILGALAGFFGGQLGTQANLRTTVGDAERPSVRATPARPANV